MKNRLPTGVPQRKGEAPRSPAGAKPKKPANFLRRGVDRGVDSIEGLIGRHPAVSLIAAASLGVLLGWLIKRR